MVLLEFSLSPLGKGESVGKYVARSIDIIDRSGVDYRLNPMGTVLEGTWDQVFSVVKACFEEMNKECNRVTAVIKVDYRRGKKGRLTGKVKSVERLLGRKIHQYSVTSVLLDRQSPYSLSEFNPYALVDDFFLMAHIQQELNGPTFGLAIIEGPIIDVHSHKFVGHFLFHVSGKLHGVVEGFITMFQGILNTFPESIGNLRNQLCPQILAYDIAPQGQRKLGFLVPPFSQINDLV